MYVFRAGCLAVDDESMCSSLGNATITFIHNKKKLSLNRSEAFIRPIQNKSHKIPEFFLDSWGNAWK